MRRVFGVAALSIFLAVNVSAVESRERGSKEPPVLKRIVSFLKHAVKSLGDAVVIPRP